MSNKIYKSYKWLFALTLALFLQACVPYLHQPMQTQRARLGPETPQNKDLQNLPAPKEKIVAAVYKFRDQTGQYKPSEMGSNWSTAISQGTTAILLRALEESKWFIAIERENIGNLLNERKIIRSSRAQYEGKSEENAPLLPPLLFGGIILEGGVISYETNILTGGIGARYFGTGMSGQYRQDMVTVYLRAVSTSNGNILKTVYTSKTILSQEVSASVFRYVSFKRLLEAETGFTFNEPSEMAVTEAIEKAVTALVIEGQQDGLWQFANPADSTSAVVKSYMSEKNSNESMDLFHRLANQSYRSKVAISGYGGINKFDGDYPGTEVDQFYGLSLKLRLNKSFNLEAGAERYWLNAGDNYSSVGHIYKVGARYLLAPHTRFTPYLEGGGGILMETGDKKIATDEINAVLNYGVGFEWMPTSKLGIFIGANQNFILSDGFDGLKQGKYNDMIWTAKAGLNIYLSKGKNKQAAVKKEGVKK